jgi:hypothetical protein
MAAKFSSYEADGAGLPGRDERPVRMECGQYRRTISKEA